MTNKNPLVVEPGQVVFEDTGTGKKPDTLDGVFISPEALSQGNVVIPIDQEPMKKVAAAFRDLLNTFPDAFAGIKASAISPGLDQIIPHLLQLSYGLDTTKAYCYSHRLTFPKDISNTFVRKLLVDFYGEYILETDVLPNEKQPTLSVPELATIFPEITVLNQIAQPRGIVAYTNKNTISNPYLLILMAEPEMRPFLCGAMDFCEQANLLNTYKPWSNIIDMNSVKSPYSLALVMKYAQKLGEKEIKKYLVEMSKLPKKVND